MPIAAGVRLGLYEIQSLIGAGEMGEVYRALDTHLGRTVAIKLLPQDHATSRRRTIPGNQLLVVSLENRDRRSNDQREP